MQKLFLPILGLFLLLSCQTEPADMVILSAKVVTVDEEFSIHEAIAIKDSQFIAIGSNSKIEKYIGPYTKTMKMDGAMVLPGLIDAHAHLHSLGDKLASLNTSDCTSFAELTINEKAQRFQDAVIHCNRMGLTGVHEACVGPKEIDIYKRLIDLGRMNIRLYAMLGEQEVPVLDIDLEAYFKANRIDNYGNNMLKVRSVKRFIDGALGSRDAGHKIPCGSDFPVESVNPLYGIYSAVTRQDHEGLPEGGWHPEQKMTIEEAIKGFTIWAAYGAWQEDVLGSIEVGKMADVTILDKDLLTIEPKEILETKVLATIVGGEVKYLEGGGMR